MHAQMDREREAAGRHATPLLTLEELPPFVFEARGGGGGGAKSGASEEDDSAPPDARQQRR